MFPEIRKKSLTKLAFEGRYNLTKQYKWMFPKLVVTPKTPQNGHF